MQENEFEKQVKNAMEDVKDQFNSDRMATEYYEQIYRVK